MTEEEKEELKNLRSDELRVKEIVYNMETERDDVNFAISNLERWKNGRSTGFILLSAVIIVFFIFMTPYIALFNESYDTRMEVKADMVTEAVSATAIIFGIMLLVILFLVDIFLGMKLIMQLGTSNFAKDMALRRGEKNYHTENEILMLRKITIQKELFEIQSELNQIRERIKVLEPLEESEWQ